MIWAEFGGFFAIVYLRFLALSGTLHWFVSIRHRERFQARRIHPKTPSSHQIRNEIGWSALTSLLYAAVGVWGWRAWQAGVTKLYADPLAHGLWYLPVSFFALAFLHDTYFYWTHRLIHHPAFFARVHKVHHDSRVPTPFAAFSFHLWEGCIEALALPLLILTIPVHVSVFAALLVLMSVMGAINHLGYEFFPRGFATHWFGRHWIFATHHQFHHERLDCNYGLYFRLWDRWMGTDRMPVAPKTP